MTENQATDTAVEQGQADARNILALYKASQAARSSDERDEAQRAVDEYPSSVQVRSAWTIYGEPLQAAQYRIELAGGGPASWIIGDLTNDGGPYDARIEAQGWGTPAFTITLDDDEREALLWFVGQFIIEA